MPVDSLLTRAHSTGNPVMDKNTATFLWHGKTPALFIDDMHNWDEAPQQMAAVGPGVWKITLKLPVGAYLEYAFLDPKTLRRVEDPLNPKKTWNGIGDWNHYFYMPGGSPTELIRPVAPVERGRVTTHRVATRNNAAGAIRSVHLYQPPVEHPVPLLVVYDGSDYLKQGKLTQVVGNLIAQKRIRPVALVLVQNGGASRLLEYSCADATLDFLTGQVIPLADKYLNLVPPGRGAYGILGASLGGLMALYTGLRLPQIFGKVLSQSGAFLLPDMHSVIGDLVRHVPPPPLQIWMDVGKLEYLLPGNRKMRTLLKKRGYQLAYREFPGGHNYTSWRNDLWRGLEYLFG